ncbi:MAG: putative toxin-antitoxin system toxin component, PIN family [Kiritimatiellae bacterium]|nr:putative toxin-antitoxin system toxin component, PIN family [Kiritimatiellia bacterium]
MRVVIDANVAIAAAASRGLCEAIFELCLEHHQIITCTALNEEIKTKLINKLRIPKPVVADFVALLKDNALMLEPELVDKSACRDLKDLMLLGLVRPGRVDAIITGDKDLLVVWEYNGARIVAPRDFWESNKKKK